MESSTRTPLDVFAKIPKHERAEQLAAAKEQDVLPYFRLLESQAGPVVEMEGREKIMLGSNNYLGLTGDSGSSRPPATPWSGMGRASPAPAC